MASRCVLCDVAIAVEQAMCPPFHKCRHVGDECYYILYRSHGIAAVVIGDIPEKNDNKRSEDTAPNDSFRPVFHLMSTPALSLLSVRKFVDLKCVVHLKLGCPNSFPRLDGMDTVTSMAIHEYPVESPTLVASE